jgi:hypothetical protein
MRIGETEIGGQGGDLPRGTGVVASSLARTDRVALEASGPSFEIVRILAPHVEDLGAPGRDCRPAPPARPSPGLRPVHRGGPQLARRASIAGRRGRDGGGLPAPDRLSERVPTRSRWRARPRRKRWAPARHWGAHLEAVYAASSAAGPSPETRKLLHLALLVCDRSQQRPDGHLQHGRQTEVQADRDQVGNVAPSSSPSPPSRLPLRSRGERRWRRRLPPTRARGILAAGRDLSAQLFGTSVHSRIVRLVAPGRGRHRG